MKLQTLFQDIVLGACGLLAGSILLSCTAGVSYRLYHDVLSEDARKITQSNKAKRVELQSLTEEAFKKAEFEDGKVGISLEDMAKMATRLGYSQRIYEGDNLFLNVDGPWGVNPPRLSLKIVKSDGSYGSAVEIDEQKLRNYVSSEDNGD